MHREEPKTGILYSHEKYRQGQYRLTEQMSLTHKLTKDHLCGQDPKVPGTQQTLFNTVEQC